MDKIEKYIVENRQNFNVFEPSPEVWKKIKQNQNKTKVIKVNFKNLFIRAAAVVVIFLSGYFCKNLFTNQTKSFQQFEYSINSVEDINETQNFYNKQVSSKMYEIQEFEKQHPELVNDIKNEIMQLDSVNSSFKNDLKDNINKQEVINAMIQNYKVKLQLLEDILQTLKQKKANQSKQKKIKQQV